MASNAFIRQVNKNSKQLLIEPLLCLSRELPKFGYKISINPERCYRCLNGSGNNILKYDNIKRRTIYRSLHLDEGKKRPLPRLVYFPNLLRWCKHKLEFKLLRIWDPEFHEGEFRFGTQQAISRITQIIQDNKFDNLEGLLTKTAKMRLIREIETLWPDKQRQLIGLEPENIHLIIPRNLKFTTILGKKICEIDLVFVALKWAEHNSRTAMVFVEVFGRFKREFQDGVIPEWTVTLFKINKFNVIER